MPITCVGRCVATASFMIGIEEVLEASTASGEMTILSRRLKRSHLGCLVLHDRLDDEVAVGQLVEVGDDPDPGEHVGGAGDLAALLCR